MSVGCVYAVSRYFCHRLLDEKQQRRFTITGVVIDEDNPGRIFSLEAFYDQVHRLTHLNDSGNGATSSIVRARI